MGELVHRFETGEPYFAFSSGVGDIVATHANSTLFLHNFENAGVDHLFIMTDETEDNYLGVFLWRVVADAVREDMFDQLACELQEHDWDTLIVDVPTQEDQANFDKYVDKQVVKVKNKAIRKWINGS